MPRPGLFFSRLKLFLGHPLLRGVAAHITIGRAVWPDVMALTKVPHGRALHDDPCGLLHIRRQLFVGPVRAIEPTPRRASFHPHLNRRPQRLGKPSRLAWCPLNLQALYAPFVIVLEPEPHRGAMHPQILGNGLALAPPTRHQDRLTPVAEAPITGRLEGVFQLLLFRCRQPNPPHLCQPPLVRNFTRGYLRKDAMSSGACISWHHSPEHQRQPRKRKSALSNKRPAVCFPHLVLRGFLSNRQPHANLFWWGESVTFCDSFSRAFRDQANSTRWRGKGWHLA